MASKEVSTYSVQDPTSGVSALGVDASGEVKRFNLGSAANRSVGTGAAAIPLNSDLGTAAVEDVQTSLTDTTADRLLKVGAFGLGETLGKYFEGSLDDLTTSGFYRVTGSSCTDAPLDFNSGVGVASVIVLQNRGYVSQYFHGARTGGGNRLTDRMFIRQRDSDNSWGDWYELLSSKTYPSDSAWTTTTSLLNSWTGTVRYIKRAGWVRVNVTLNSTSATSTIFLGLPAGYRPGEIQSNSASGNTAHGYIEVGTGGGVLCTATGATVKASLVYPVL